MTDSTREIVDTIDGVILHDLTEGRERFGNGPGFGPIFDVTNGENARHLAGKIRFGHYRDGHFYANVPGGSDAALTVAAPAPESYRTLYLKPSKPEVMTVGWFRGILDEFADDDVLEIEADGERIHRIEVRGAREEQQR